MRKLLLVPLAAALCIAWYTTAQSDALAAQIDHTSANDATVLVAPQVDDQGDGASDSRVDVQVWTILAAGGAASVGLLLLLLRIVMGWVKAPPPPEEAHH